jgi:hypothetical protein
MRAGWVGCVVNPARVPTHGPHTRKCLEEGVIFQRCVKHVQDSSLGWHVLVEGQGGKHEAAHLLGLGFKQPCSSSGAAGACW